MAARPAQNSKKVELFLPEEAAEELRTQAISKGMSLSGYLRFILLEFLDKK